MGGMGGSLLQISDLGFQIGLKIGLKIGISGSAIQS
jgi:hypothetical protein